MALASSSNTAIIPHAFEARPLYDADFTFFTSPENAYVLILSPTLEECEVIYMTLDESSRTHESPNAKLDRQSFALTVFDKHQHHLRNCRECVKEVYGRLRGVERELRDLSDMEADGMNKVRMVRRE